MGKLAMGREVKIGLAVIGSLLLTLGAVLYKQLTRRPDVPVVTASEKAAPPLKSPIEVAKRSLPGADRFSDDESAGGKNHKWLRASASEPAADDPRDAGAPPQRSFLPSVKDEPAAGHDESFPDRYGAGTHEPAADDDSRHPRQDAAGERDPFSHPHEDAPPETPSAPAEHPQLSPGPDAREIPHDDPLRSSGIPHRAATVLAAAQEPVPVAAGDDGGGARNEEPPRRRDLDDGNAAAQPQARIEDAAPAQREFPPLTGRLPEARPATAAENGVYTVQPNDNYWIISEKVYGTGGYFKAIHQQNRNKFPQADRLQVGDKILVPPVAQLEQDYPDLCPKRRHVRPPRSATIPASARQRVGGKIYVVQEGDTLFDIARFQLGKATRWAEIYDLNRESLGDDFDFLQPGTELTLPGSPQDEDALTRRRGSTERR